MVGQSINKIYTLPMRSGKKFVWMGAIMGVSLFILMCFLVYFSMTGFALLIVGLSVELLIVILLELHLRIQKHIKEKSEAIEFAIKEKKCNCPKNDNEELLNQFDYLNLKLNRLKEEITKYIFFVEEKSLKEKNDLILAKQEIEKVSQEIEQLGVRMDLQRDNLDDTVDNIYQILKRQMNALESLIGDSKGK